MSVYKPKGSPFYYSDFWLDGCRFLRSTKCTSKPEAKKVENVLREKAKCELAQAKAARTSMLLDDVAGRYWHEVGQHHAAARDTERQIGFLIEFFGKKRPLTEITDDDVARFVAWRRGHRVRGKGVLSPFTVNDGTKQLKKLFSRAKLWGVRFDHEPTWRNHWIKVPPERVRELHDDEAERLEAAMREDYAPFFAFARASGLRLRECLLKWSEVDWGAKKIRKPGKGGRMVGTDITPTVREILWPLRGHDPVHVFTYVAKTTRNGRVRGRRYPITYNGVCSRWQRLRKQAGVTGFRFHDFRHDLATKALRETGNLKVVQRMLNHSDIKTTTRYAHVADEEVADALERVAQSRARSQTHLRKIG